MNRLDVFLSLGSVIAKVCLKGVVGGNALAEEAGNELIDLIRSKTNDPITQRRASSFFSSVAEETAANLEKLAGVQEFIIDENEKSSAILSLQETLDNSDINYGFILKKNLDPNELEKNILSKGRNKDYGLLSEAGKTYFDRLLRDSCSFIVEIFRQLPNSNELFHRETLRRTDDILYGIEHIIDKINSSSVSSDEKDRDFEARYQRALIRKLSAYSLFGLDVDSSIKNIDLDVSYISLSAEKTGTESPDSLEIEKILSDDGWVAISGSPGSGKTTLVHWIGLMAAKSSFPPELSSWNNSIPFVVPLRKYSDKDLPSINELVDFSSSLHKEMMPEDWVLRVLNSGKGIILIDGLDEVSDDKAEEALDWLFDLVNEFSSCSFIVTSRPNAMNLEWFREFSFATVELQPMTPQSISMFIDHWHEAALLTAKSIYTKNDLDSFKRRLKLQIDENYRLRNMASTPLLCAMLCALNIDRNAVLPKGRDELYRIIIEVLLERRDSERKISRQISGEFTRSCKELLLQSLAYWMLVNNKPLVSLSEADSCFKRAAMRIPNLSGREEEITRYLLDRSTIIRESSEGYVDFVHKTFSEYLAAKYIVNEDSIDQLLENSIKKAWQEVIVMASMHTNHRQSNLLISGLIEKGNEQPSEVKYELHLVAIAAKENAQFLDPAIAEESNDILKSLLPPRSTESSLFISSVGEMAVPFLKYYEGMNQDEIYYSVKTLSLIGGAGSIDALSSYSNVGVTQLLVSTWNYFDQSEYARKVIGNINKITHLNWPHVESLSGVEYLSNVISLRFDGINVAYDDEYLAINSTMVENIEFYNCRGLLSLDFISDNNKIKSLVLNKCDDLIDVKAVSKSLHLGELIINSCFKVTNIPNLSELKNLTKVSMDGCIELDSLSFLEGCKVLRNISIDNCPDIGDLSPLFSCGSIDTIRTDNSLLIDLYADRFRKAFL